MKQQSRHKRLRLPRNNVIRLENSIKKVQYPRDLKDDTILYQVWRKNDQGHCDPTTRSQATIVTCTIFEDAKNHARMMSFHKKFFIESKPFNKLNPLTKLIRSNSKQ